jgi:flavin reductase (DIM6/NTAB) family NADH-FMN oxidoreductase RutF
MLASWVMQAGFEPPMISVALRRDRFIVRWLTPEMPFVINVIADGQKTLLSHFGRGFDEGEPAFKGVELRAVWRDVPVLAGTAGYLECVARDHVDSGDHRILTAEVIGGHAEDVEPWVHLRSNGLRY